MKKLILIAACFLTTSRLLAQDCSSYLYMQKNKTIEMTMFAKNGTTVTAKSISKVSDVNTSGGVTTANVTTELFDKSGKSLGTTNADYQCDGTGIRMQMHVDTKDKSAQNSTVNVKFTGNNSEEYPQDMKVGDHLKDYTTQMQLINGMNTTLNVTDRQVLAKESITTPAGTWDCFKISYKSSASTDFTKGDSDGGDNKITSTFSKLGIKMPTSTSETTVWYAPGFGAIKIQTKNSIMEITGLK